MALPDKYIDFDKISDEFNASLNQTLRGHGTGFSFLDFWVPDADKLLGLAGMIDSARLAGERNISIKVSSNTISKDQLVELSSIVKQNASIEKSDLVDGCWYVTIGKFRKNTNTTEESVAKTASNSQSKKPEWSVQNLDFETTEAKPWPACPDGKWDDVHPALRGGLGDISIEKVEHAKEKHEDAETEYLTASSDGVELILGVSKNSSRVIFASSSGWKTEAEKLLLGLFCKDAIKLPIQEVADHLGLKVLDKVARKSSKFPVPGILLPKNAGLPFCLGADLARKIFDDYTIKNDLDRSVNFFQPLPPESWRSKDNGEREWFIRQALEQKLKVGGFSQGDMALLRLEKNKIGEFLRGIVVFSPDLESEKKPKLMREFEDHIRELTNADIELVADRLGDTSPLRRLTTDELRKSKKPKKT